MAGDLFLVFTNPVDGHEDAFNEWYDTKHVSEVLAVPGVSAARRYELVPATPPQAEGVPELPAPAHRYLAVYELDGDPDAVVGEFLRRVTNGEMELSETLDLATVAMASWRPRGPRRQS